METMLVLTADEVREKIPYSLICETRYGSSWNTMHRKRIWKTNFTEAERRAATRLLGQAKNWTLVHGVPDKVTMSVDTYYLWQKLGRLCACV